MSPVLKDKVANEIKAKGGEAVAKKTDISDENATKKMAEEVIKQYGKVDILINNAAIWYGFEITPWDVWTVEEWNRIFAVNVRGTWLCCKAIAPMMIKQKRGKIINIASAVAKDPGAAQLWLPYSCSKGAIYTLTHVLARALGPSGINVNAIAPGYTASEASFAQCDSERTFKTVLLDRSIQRHEEPADLPSL
jgi:3-oxoacyl-[acyl-carrier protein] reductase